MPTKTRQWLVNGCPRGRPLEAGDFRLVETEIGDPAPGQMLLATRWLGFDPAQKGWMENIADYVAPLNIGDVMRGSGIAEVIASNDGPWPVGTLVSGMTGWTEHLLHDGTGLSPVETRLPPSASLSVLGLTGMTAWCGLFKVGLPVVGDTVLVSGAAGSTGSLVGQLAKAMGCRTIGIAGGPEKCAWLVEQAGFDHAIDYKAGDIGARIREVAPNGADVVYDNVGGRILNEMIGQIATGARVVICGGISRHETGAPVGPQNYMNLIFRRARMQGFIVNDWQDEFPVIRDRLVALVQQGRLAWQEDVQKGFEQAPAALMRLFVGANRGKQLLEL